MSLASVFSRCLPARVPLEAVRAGRAAAPSLSPLVAALALAGSVASLNAQANAPGTLDTTFTSALTGSTIYGVVTAELGPTPIIIAAGDIGTFGELNENGTVNTSVSDFTVGNVDRIIYTVENESFIATGQSFPKILIGGLFGKSAAETKAKDPAMNIARLLIDGTVDPDFQPGKGTDNSIVSILSEPNGDIVLGGLFTTYNKVTYNHVVRLLNNGSVDPSFNPTLDVDDGVLAVAAQIPPSAAAPQEQILIAGTFNKVNGAPPAKIARLNSDGSLDTSFNPTVDTRVLAIAPLPNGQILIGGDFTNVNGTVVSKIARLNYDGSLDTTFACALTSLPAGDVNPIAVYTFAQNGDGRIYVGGNFAGINGVTRNYLARIEADGSLDTTFDPGTAVINSVQSIALEVDSGINKVVVGETVSRKVNNVFLPSLVRLYADPIVVVVEIPVIQIAASKPTAREGVPASGDLAGVKPSNGQFVVTRTGAPVTSALTVYVELAGTAAQGIDYKNPALTQVPGTNRLYTLTIPAGSASVTIGVRPARVTLADSPETVIATLQGNPVTPAAYTLDAAAESAMVDIFNAK